jgi:hypothetical protein
MKPSSSVERADREKGAIWAIDLIEQGTPPELHLIVVDASTRTKVLGEPVQNFAQVHGVLQRAFKRIGAPEGITTDRGAQYFSDGFQQLLGSFGVRHIVRVNPFTPGAVERFVRSKP